MKNINNNQNNNENQINQKLNQIEIYKTIPFITYSNNKLIINEEAKKIFTSINYNNIGIISIFGKYHTGKSFLLNHLFDENNNNQIIFKSNKLNNEPYTKGIQLYTKPIIIENNHCNEKFPCFIIDTEGLNYNDNEYDCKIFLIILLLSSIIIYNDIECINNDSIKNLEFILKLNEIIKFENLDEIYEKIKFENYKNFLPSLLWLIRDSNIKLEDEYGNIITEKQYLENNLIEKKGLSDKTYTENLIKNYIKNYFIERDCYCMENPFVEKNINLNESNENGLNKKENNKKKEEKENKEINIKYNLEEKIKNYNFENKLKALKFKLSKKVKPKFYMKKNLNGHLLIELIEIIINCINEEKIPVIDNCWKIVLKNIIIKKLNLMLKNFAEKILNFRKENIDDLDLIKKFDDYGNQLIKESLENFEKNYFFDEDLKQDFYIKFKKKILGEFEKLKNENEKNCEEKYKKYLNLESNSFLNNINNNIEKYENNNFYLFFQEIEKFKNKNENFQNFNKKKEILFEKLVFLIRKFIETQNLKNKIFFEQKITNFQNLIKNYEEKNKNLNLDSQRTFDNYSEQIKNLNIELVESKSLNKNYEEKIKTLNLEKENLKNEYENIISNLNNEKNDLLNQKNNNNSDLKKKENDLIILKLNAEKTILLNEQKIKYLENEIKKLQESFDNIKNEKEKNENELNKIIDNLNKENENLKIKNIEIEKKLNLELQNAIQNFENKIELQELEYKNNLQKLINSNKQLENEQNKIAENLKTLQNQNSQLKLKENSYELKNKTLNEQIIKLNLYKDIIHNSIQFICKNCNKNFSFENFKLHFKSCTINNNNNYNGNKLNNNLIKNNQNIKSTPNLFNNNNNNNLNDKFNFKFIKSNFKIDEFGKPFLEYTIEVNNILKKIKYQIKKKYNQFISFYNEIKNFYKKPLPDSSQIFTNITQKKNLENKSSLLENFLNDISNINEINLSNIFRNFIEFKDKINILNNNNDNNENFIHRKNTSNITNKTNLFLNDDVFPDNFIKNGSKKNIIYNENLNINKEKENIFNNLRSSIDNSDQQNNNSDKKTTGQTSNELNVSDVNNLSFSNELFVTTDNLEKK